MPDREALLNEIYRLKDQIFELKAANFGLKRELSRYNKFKKGRALTVVVPTPIEGNPNKKVTIIYGPNPEQNFGAALDYALDQQPD